MFIQANIANFLAVFIAVLIVLFFGEISIPTIYIFFLCYVDIWFFKIVCEYQRITFMISRVAKLKGSKLSISELQILMTNSYVGVLLFLKALLTGFIIGYLFLNSILFLFLFLLFQYVLNLLVPGYVPFNYLFKLIREEISKNDVRDMVLFVEKVSLHKYFEEIPHTSKYEDWILRKYGNGLLEFR